MIVLLNGLLLLGPVLGVENWCYSGDTEDNIKEERCQTRHCATFAENKDKSEQRLQYYKCGDAKGLCNNNLPRTREFYAGHNSKVYFGYLFCCEGKMCNVPVFLPTRHASSRSGDAGRTRPPSLTAVLFVCVFWLLR